jgi:hypothetical protein
MGTGASFQKQLVALHHLDASNPSAPNFSQTQIPPLAAVSPRLEYNKRSLSVMSPWSGLGLPAVQCLWWPTGECQSEIEGFPR